MEMGGEVKHLRIRATRGQTQHNIFPLLLYVSSESSALYLHYVQDNPGDLHLNLEPESSDATEEAKGLFYKICDRIVEEQSGRVTKAEHRILREQLAEECDVMDEGKPKRSDLTKEELWKMTSLALDWAHEAGAYVKDLEVR